MIRFILGIAAMKKFVGGRLSSVLAIAFLGVVSSSCAVSQNFQLAQRVATNIPVVVVAEDQDKTSLNHCSDVHRRVTAELKGAMQRYGFQTLDEQSVASDLGWTDGCASTETSANRRSKRELVDSLKLMNKANQASARARAWVLYRIHAQGKNLKNSTSLEVRIVGEIYDSASNNFLDNFQMPRENFPAPANCGKICIAEVLGDRASDIAMSLGDVLARKLERYSQPNSAGRAEPAAGAEMPVIGRNDSVEQGMVTPYTFTLRHFNKSEALTIIGVMADEFPGYIVHDLMSSAAVVRKYDYRTTAKAHKLEEWLMILLRDMGFKDKEFTMQISGTKIRIDKLIPTPARPVSPDEKARFK